MKRERSPAFFGSRVPRDWRRDADKESEREGESGKRTKDVERRLSIWGEASDLFKKFPFFPFFLSVSFF